MQLDLLDPIKVQAFKQCLKMCCFKAGGSAISVIILRYIFLNEKFGFFYADYVSPILCKFHYFRDCGPKIVKCETCAWTQGTQISHLKQKNCNEHVF